MKRDDLIYLCKNTGDLASIPVRLYQKDMPVYFYSNQEFPADPLLPDLAMKDSSDSHVSYFIGSFFSYYGVVNFPEGQIVIGPVFEIEPDERDLTILALRCGVGKNDLPAFRNAVHTIVQMPLNLLLMMLMSINFALNHEKLELKDIITTAADQDFIRRQKNRQQLEETAPSYQADLLHNTYPLEQTMLAMVRSGNLAAVQAWADQAPAFRSGIVAEDELRQLKNIFIVSTTLISRAAIEGGMSPGESFSMSDAYIQQCEKLHLPIEIANMQYHVICEYTRRVQETKFGSSRLIREVSAYVQQHMHESISTQQIADAMHISRPYLSKSFRQDTGVSLADFIRQRKVETAAELLLTTDQSAASIADYLGFSNASHFSAVFRKYRHMTPSAFRSLHASADPKKI
jgi:AraC-like DNA-binding protein